MIDIVYDELNEKDSTLAVLREGDSIKERTKGLGELSPEFKMSASGEKYFSAALIAGDKCSTRAKEMSYFVRNMAKTFAILNDPPRDLNGREFGELSGWISQKAKLRGMRFLLFSNGRIRCFVSDWGVFEYQAHFLMNPDPEILSSRGFYVSVKNITPPETARFGLKLFTFTGPLFFPRYIELSHSPKSIPLKLTDIFSPGPVCLYNVHVKEERGLPDRVFVAKKKGVARTSNGWMFEYADEIYTINRIEVEGISAAKAGAEAKSQADEMVRMLEFRELYGRWGEGGVGYCADDSDESSELSTAPNFILQGKLDAEGLIPKSDDDANFDPSKAGLLPADEIVDEIRIPEDDRIDMMDKVDHLIDYNRYIAAIGSKSAVVTAWWRKSKKRISERLYESS